MSFFGAPAASAAAGAPKERSLPWVEKYRPKTIDDVAFQDEVVHTLKSAIETGQFPHLLFYGPPGTGKTSTILAVAKGLWGPELYKQRVLELNASDERGINVVRTKIKDFAQLSVGAGVPGYPCPPFKLIILDEADSMTSDAQSALRRTMEVYTKVTRFCILCNYVSRIIEPLTSRCAKFRFKPLSPDTIAARLQLIGNAEGVQMADDTVRTLVNVSGGDMRKAITLMQSATRLNGTAVTSDMVVDIAGVVPPSVIDGLTTAMRSNSFEQVEAAVSDIKASGYSAEQVIYQLQELSIPLGDVDDQGKSRLALRLAEADKALRDGADEYLQLLDSCAFMLRVFCKLPLGDP